MPVSIEGETRLAPRSLVIRRHPVSETQKAGKVQVARASQLTKIRSRPLSAADVPPWQHRAAFPSHTKVRKQHSFWPLLIGIGMLCAFLLAIGTQFLMERGITLKDDLQYGRPRTTQIDHFVGHERDTSIPTHFTAINLKGKVYIFEIPGGDTEHTHLLLGPRLLGSGADLAPVTLTFSGDAYHPDLVVSVDGLQMRFRNIGNTYEPMA
ncbi:hypothetical protein [Ktedonospora formicarum]|uniref:Uncharacterized protein n=1 Tax=Ktedonospora formicarum TaxID=2778364 RepID=A0A8J3MXF2_9CHLR|nr:hypothetical protein [Ktedonospora formicarum]GHO48500.1 hypothetical protein KSX_66630 [Ktedonospora formicarum]